MRTAKKANGGARAARAGSGAGRDDAPAVVCGGAGFLGAHVCARLLGQGKRVICIDNFCTSDESAVDHLLEDPRFELRRQDVATLDVEEIEHTDAIFNMACAASPVHYQRNPLQTLFSSVQGMDRLLSLARRCGARIFQASTSEIYGHPEVHPQTERYWGYVNPAGPRSCYDEGKRCAETLCYIYRQQYGVAVRVGRIFNTYGPGMRLTDGRVVINFIVQALNDSPITVYGDGTQTRSFCYVDDLIDAIMLLMAPGNDFAGPVNLGNPLEIRVLDLAERIVRLTGSRSRIRVEPLPIDDPPRRRPDISLAAEALGWRPRVDLDAGLMRTIEYVERALSEADEVDESATALGARRAAMNARVTAL